MTPQERNARRYCWSLGLNPDELVLGVNEDAFYRKKRWMWYVGAIVEPNIR